MIIKSFTELSIDEKKRLYDYIISIGCSHYFDNFKEMVKDYIGIVFNYGESHFSLWDDVEVRGTLAVITKEVKEKGEAFITGINIREEDSRHFSLLLDRGLNYISTLEPEIIKLGIYTSISYLIPVVLEHGFNEVYKAMIMRYKGGSSVVDGSARAVEFQSICEDNKKVFQSIHNRAFIKSPNGSIQTDEQLEDIMREYKDCPQLAGVCLYEGRPSGMYELSIKNSTGWIECLAVDPDHWGMGIARELLGKSVKILLTSGAEEVKLFVISSNTRAVNLYERNGFIQEKVTSRWFEKRNEKRCGF